MSEHEDVVSKDGKAILSTYYSMDELADASERRLASNGQGLADWIAGESQDDAWRGGSWDECLALARSGWTDQLDAALEIAESAIEMCEREHEVEQFTPVWDVSGAEVDIARYLSGEPENMIDYPMLTISRVGRVITLCASVGYSAAISAEVIIRRGQIITALAMALSRLGHATELWIDHTAERGEYKSRIRCLVKGANDTLDPARIMYAYAHPSVCRALCFGAMNGLPSKFRKNLGVSRGGGYGLPLQPIQDMPEGTIYLPAVRRSYDLPDAHTELRKYLGELGLLREE